MKQAIFKLPDDLHRQLKVTAYMEGKTMTEIAIRLFREYLQIKTEQ